MLIKIPTFKGVVPRVPARSLPPEFAQSATNADLNQGLLKGFYGLSATKTLNTTAWRSIFPVKSGTTFWACSEQEAHFINAPVYNSGERFYYTDGVRGMESNYALASNDGGSTYGDPNTTYYLGVPKPSAALTVTVQGAGDGTVVDSVSYIYTFITSWGYEGEPSDPTDVSDVEGGQYVELGNFEIPVPTGYNIVGIRIYRTSTGSDETDYQFVSEAMTGASDDYITPAEITNNGDIWDDKDAGDSELTDADDLGEVIACEDYIAPPSALSGLLALPNGVVAAYREKEVYLSEPYIHYGFPDDYVVRTNEDIKAIGHYGTTVVVGTEGRPYKINGYDPQSVSAERLPDKQSCLFSRAMVSGNSFVLYPSPDGLYKIGEDGNGLVTKGIFTKEQWKDLLTTSTAYDKTIIAFLYDGKYYAFFQGTDDGFIVDFDSEFQSYAEFSLGSTYSVYGGYLDEIDDALYLLVKVGSTYYIKKWEGDTASNLIYTWKSKVFVTSFEFFSCMKINGDFVSDSTGTGTISSSGTAVTGTGTSFTTELAAKNVIYEATLKEYREVLSVTDDTHCTLVSGFSSNVSGKAFKYNSAMINIYKDDSLFFTRGLNSTKAFRLPSGRGSEWEIEFKSDRKIYEEVKMAQAMSELI
jgi:hypothetical protein